jgi:hypothetical protein
MTTITDLGGFVKAVDEISLPWSVPGANWYVKPWFRGHRVASWGLRPGWYRNVPAGTGVGEEWYTEPNLLSEVKFRAPRHIASIGPMPTSDWEWWYYMQHYGLPTRLLDWTESSLTALYFAVRDLKDGDPPAAVWMVNPWWINKQTTGNFDIPYSGDPFLLPWLPDAGCTHTLPKVPVAMKPIHANPRIAVQHGLFTIHGAEADGLDRLQYCKNDCGPQMEKIEIPSALVSDLKRQLLISGVSETAVYNDLDGLCREVKDWFFGT